MLICFSSAWGNFILVPFSAISSSCHELLVEVLRSLLLEFFEDFGELLFGAFCYC